MNQNPNYPPGSNPNNPGANYGTSYGSNYPGSGPNPGTNPNPYNPYPQNPPSGPNPNTNPNPYNPYPQNPPSGPNPNTDPYDPYGTTVASSGSYPGYNPYTPIPPTAPPSKPPTPPRSSPFSARALLLIGLAVLVILAGILVIFGVVIPYQTTQANNVHATATAESRTAATAQANTLATAVSSTATVSANATASVIASHYPFSNNLVLDDPLYDNSHGNKWTEGPDNAGGNCQFTEGAYHVSEAQIGYFYNCFAGIPDFSNFTFEVKMKIIKGDAGGFIFRADQTNSKFYYLSIGQDGSFSLSLYVDNNGNHAQTLKSGSVSGAITGYYTGLNQYNVIGVVARGSSIDLYANGQRFAGVTDSLYSHGQIALVADSYTGPTEVAYSDARVWHLP